MSRALDVAAVVVVSLAAALLGVVEVAFLPLYLGAVPLPLGALLAALTNALAVLALAPLFRRTAVVGTPLAAWLLVVLGLGAGGPGGDTMLVGDWRALLLLGLGVVPAALLLGRHLGTGIPGSGPGSGPAAGAGHGPRLGGADSTR